MRVLLFRHGRTAWNAERRYQGRSDIPLSPEGERALRPHPFRPAAVYVSPLVRARRTAELLFPGVPHIVVEDFREMDFGRFEGRTADEMERDDPAYRTWVEGGCVGRCPGGESLAEFEARVTAAFCRVMEEAEGDVVIVAHGGVQMAIPARFARPPRGYFGWQTPCGEALLFDAARWTEERVLEAAEGAGNFPEGVV